MLLTNNPIHASIAERICRGLVLEPAPRRWHGSGVAEAGADERSGGKGNLLAGRGESYVTVTAIRRCR
jgi:hypothetical protein